MRRYSILFIDDDEVIRESFLKLVDWEKQQFDVAGVFKNGEDAWTYLKKQPVDIIVTDINMPFMNGIDLLENVKKNIPSARVLLMTGYEYFEYAQKAIQLKAFDFLLKPVTTEKLLNAVEKAASDIEREEAAKEAAETGQKLSESFFINELFGGKIRRGEIEKKAETMHILSKGGSYLVLLASIDAMDGKEVKEDEWTEIKRNCQNAITNVKTETAEEGGVEFSLYFARNISRNIQMLLVSSQKNFFNDDFSHCFAKKVRAADVDARCIVTCAVGRNRSRIEEIPESFENVMGVLKSRHIIGTGRVIYASDLKTPQTAADQIVLPTDSLLSHIRMGMPREVEEDIKRIYDSFRHEKYISLESAKMVTTELAITAFKGEVTVKGESVSYLYYLNHIQQLNTLDEMERDITAFAVNVAEKKKKGRNHKQQTAEKALEYLREHYQNVDLSLNDVALYLNISVPYLAVLFKQETGQNFGGHLLDIRMEKAKELLKTTALTVSEIAEKVGYSSSQYFAVCFKKSTGSSPGCYRNEKQD